MKQFQLNMLGYQRPVIDLYGQLSIIDTGAVIPMTSMDTELMKLAWNAKITKENISIGGIGGQVNGDIYSLNKQAKVYICSAYKNEGLDPIIDLF